MKSTGLTRRRSERGAAAVEWALLAPLFVLIICAMVAGWRLQSARAGIAHAAEAAARSASLERTASSAATAGSSSAYSNLAVLPCRQSAVSVDVAAFSVPAGQPATVRARISCEVPLADLLVPGLPGSIRVEADAATPLDRYRGRG